MVGLRELFLKMSASSPPPGLISPRLSHLNVSPLHSVFSNQTDQVLTKKLSRPSPPRVVRPLRALAAAQNVLYKVLETLLILSSYWAGGRSECAPRRRSSKLTPTQMLPSSHSNTNLCNISSLCNIHPPSLKRSQNQTPPPKEKAQLPALQRNTHQTFSSFNPRFPEPKSIFQMSAYNEKKVAPSIDLPSFCDFHICLSVKVLTWAEMNRHKVWQLDLRKES